MHWKGLNNANLALSPGADTGGPTPTTADHARRGTGAMVAALVALLAALLALIFNL